jgi:hypothetical protein
MIPCNDASGTSPCSDKRPIAIDILLRYTRYLAMHMLTGELLCEESEDERRGGRVSPPYHSLLPDAAESICIAHLETLEVRDLHGTACIITAAKSRRRIYSAPAQLRIDFLFRSITRCDTIYSNFACSLRKIVCDYWSMDFQSGT